MCVCVNPKNDQHVEKGSHWHWQPIKYLANCHLEIASKNQCSTHTDTHFQVFSPLYWSVNLSIAGDVLQYFLFINST